MAISLLHNITLLVALSIVHGLIMRRWRSGTLTYQILSGLLFGGVALICMLTPVRLMPGIIFDGRSIIISIAGLFGGPVTAVIAASMAAAYRIWLGGAGAVMGVSVITEAACLGILWHFLRRLSPVFMRPLSLLGFGVLVHLVMLMLTRTLPGAAFPAVFHEIALPVITIYPVATVLVCMLFLDQESRLVALEALQEREEMFRTLFSSSKDACFLLENGAFTDCNDAALTMWRATREQILGQRPGMLSPPFQPDGRPSAEEGDKMAVIALEKGGHKFEWVLRRPDGSDFWVEAVATAISLHGRQAVYATCRDITERKKTEDDLRRLASAVEQAGESITITDSSGVIQYVNPAFERITGYSRAEALGETPDILKSDRQDGSAHRELWKVISEGEVWSGRLINRKKDGTDYYADISVSPIRDADGQIINFVSLEKDVTHEVELEEHLHRAQRLESVGLLAGGVAHDLNNLLVPILGYGEMLLDDTDIKDSQRQDIEEMVRASGRARDLVRQLLAFGRKQTLEVRPLDLNYVITGFAALLRRTLREDIRLELNLGPMLLSVKADRSQLEQVLMNLVVNAQEAMPQGGSLLIETGNVTLDEDYAASHPNVTPGEYVLLAVSDTGTGMDEETQMRVFDPFFTTRELGKGVGLGLATVYGIVRQHGGSIWVYSEIGSGTTFKIYLPAVDVPAEIEEVPAFDEGGLRGTETILVAEDDATVRDVTRTMLKRCGYHVVSAASPRDCLVAAERLGTSLDLLLTDVVMPEMSGMELYEKLRERRPGLKALFMSGYTANVIADRGVLTDGVAFIQKPFTRHALTQKIRQLLHG